MVLAAPPSSFLLRPSTIVSHFPKLRSLYFSLSSPFSSASTSPLSPPPTRGNKGGVRFEETVGAASERARIDTWVSSRMGGVSQARVQSNIKSGMVFVNGKAVNKVSYLVKAGDKVSGTIE